MVGSYSGKEEALVRNVDLPIFGQNRVRSIIDLNREQAEKVRSDLNSDAIDIFRIHLAEGIDESSRQELDTLIGYGLLGEETVIIHGTALTEEQLGQVREADAKLVWSPQSNLRLYGQTTRAAHALSMNTGSAETVAGSRDRSHVSSCVAARLIRRHCRL